MILLFHFLFTKFAFGKSPRGVFKTTLPEANLNVYCTVNSKEGKQYGGNCILVYCIPFQFDKAICYCRCM